MRFDVLTLFPEMISGATEIGITGRAKKNKLIEINTWNPRDFTNDKHKTVDDRPYGGGPGMVMKYQPLHDALIAAKHAIDKAGIGDGKIVYLSPQGRPITQVLLQEASKLPQLTLVAGRYEGIDERFIQLDCDEEWSLGDYVLSGGELATLIVIDAITRLLPGALGDEDSAQQDSHADGLLDCPHYTRPEEVEGFPVPGVLLNGNHADIERWRLQQSLGKTWQKRPDLLAKMNLTPTQQTLLEEYKELNNQDDKKVRR